MAKLTIDGKEIAYEGKKMILQVALESGHEMPHYCYHQGLSIVASCRICLAEVASPNPRNNNALELIPKLMPTCQTPAADGMVVYTKSPKSIANQKAVMEYLLINHPLDCPVCDQAGECHLQDYSFNYGRAESRFQEEKIKQPKKDIGLNVVLYSDRCIMCTRCVRFTKEVTGTQELGVYGRGNREQIDVFPGKPLNNELSGNVVDICPVGALLDKDFLFTQRVWFLTKSPSIDGITSSGDNISLEHNEGKIYRLKPRFNKDVNKWWTSDEIRYGWKFIHSTNRLRAPKRMQLGSQIDTEWPRAYEAAREGLTKAAAEKGPGALALLVSPMLACEEAYLLAKLARAIDPAAVLGVGPIPVGGQDKAFPGGYTIRAEKCPNSRGVRRALELVAGDPAKVLSFADFVASVGDKATKTAAVLLTGNYAAKDNEAATWATPELAAAVKGKFVVLLDTLASDVAAKADLLLPSVTWAEKAGTFENATGLLQSFAAAIPATEFARPEGQIALDLLAACGLGPRGVYDAAKVRQEIGGVFVTDVRHPAAEHDATPDMEFVEL
ncbi:MAG: molybdopterin-dependent oxidoreductase [Planctomycetota bacterium]|nr:molybdopterin-dependent oxidoreductase [Planctomycetota bacterium]